MENILLIVAIVLHSIEYNVALNISVLSEGPHDGVEVNCTANGHSRLIPFHILQNANVSSVVIKTLAINESAWVGGQMFNIGCLNDSKKLCNVIEHEQLPADMSLNYSCVQGNQTGVKFLTDSTKPANFVNSTQNCKNNGGRLPVLNNDYPLTKLPTEVQKSDRGPQWLEKFDTGVLKNSVVRRCRFVTKIDECTFRIDFGDCDAEARKGTCYRDPDTEFKETLNFHVFYENMTHEVKDLIDTSLCIVKTTVMAETTDRKTTFMKETIEITESDIQSTKQTMKSTSQLTQQVTEYSTNVVHTSTVHWKPRVENVTGTALPSEPVEVASAANNLWIIGIVIIVLVIVAIFAVTVVLKRKRRSGKMSLGNPNRKHTISAPMEGSLRRQEQFATGLGMDVLQRNIHTGLESSYIEVTDLDADNNTSKENDEITILSLNHNSSVNRTTNNIMEGATNHVEEKNDDKKSLEGSKVDKSNDNKSQDGSPVDKNHDNKSQNGSPVDKNNDNKSQDGSPVDKNNDNKSQDGSPVDKNNDNISLKGSRVDKNNDNKSQDGSPVDKNNDNKSQNGSPVDKNNDNKSQNGSPVDQNNDNISLKGINVDNNDENKCLERR